MTYARVRDAAGFVARRAAQSRVADLLPHELAALTWLDQHLTDDQRRQFTELWRAEGSPAAHVTPNPFEAVRPLLDLIAAGEGNYNSVNRGKAGDTPGGRPDLQRLTIGEIQKLQGRGELFAVGRYQFIPTTLKIAVEAAGFTAADLFTAERQDWLAVALLLGGKRPKLRDYLMGKAVPLFDAQTDLAYEWASIPLPSGKGAYDGDAAGNRATAKVKAVQDALRKAREGLAGRPIPQLRLPAQQPERPAQPQRPFLRLTRTGRRDGRGLEVLRLERIANSLPMAALNVTSGAPGAQAFRTGAQSQSGSLEPLPEGRWRVGDIEWAGGRKDDYSGSWGPGLGAVWVPLEYVGPGKTRRKAIGAHLDSNATVAPGSAGCVVFANVADLQTFVRWLRADDPQDLFVDWGLGTCPKPA